MSIPAYVFTGNSLVVPLGSEESAAPLDGAAAKKILAAAKITSAFTLTHAGVNEPFANVYIIEEAPENAAARPIRSLIHLPENTHLLRAWHIVQWRNASAFCGSCGAKNEDSKTETARVCPACGRTEYPRISPAVIVLIHDDGGRVLLAHNNNFADNIYSLVAGFVEAGESLEDAVRREVAEEVSLQVDNIRYEASQSWPFPNSLMLAFHAHFCGGTLRPDGIEIGDAKWFTKDTLPNLPGPGSIARRMINLWLAQ